MAVRAICSGTGRYGVNNLLPGAVMTGAAWPRAIGGDIMKRYNLG